jgi:predicted component of type VI protein secretion system
VAKIFQLTPGLRVTKQATKRVTKEKKERLHQLGVNPDLGEIVVEYAKMTRMSVGEVTEAAFDAFRLREKYAQLLEEKAAKARTVKRAGR